MVDRAWKATERAIAKRLGGRRQPSTGRRSADIVHPWLAIEVKHRQELPEWLKEAMQQAVAVASSDQLAIAILHERYRRHSDDLVVMRLKDFEDWFGNNCEQGEGQ